MKPREFVSSFSNKHSFFNGGVYSVGLSIDGHLLDYQFHINRLQRSNELLLQVQDGIRSSDTLQSISNYSSVASSSLDDYLLSDLILEKCGDALRLHEMQSSKKNPFGVITMCYSFDWTNSQPNVEALFSPTSFDFAGMDTWPHENVVNLRPWERRIKEAKYCSWVDERRHLEIRDPSISETLMLSDWGGEDCHISEGLVSNIFAVDKEGHIVIPPVGVCLEGSMNQLVMACLNYLNIPYSRRYLKFNELKTWQGMFLISAMKHILPVGKVLRADVADQSSLTMNYDLTTKEKIISLRKLLGSVLSRRQPDILDDFLGRKLWYKL